MQLDYSPIRLDAAFGYQQAAIHAVRSMLGSTHGSAFAAAFVVEHRQDILRAARTRLCGSSELAVAAEAIRLSDALNGP
jgi:hypothetical protein